MFKQTAQEVHARRIIAQIAKREDISEEEVRCAMQEAIMAGFHSPDPQIQAYWKQISASGDAPTPEEFIMWAGRKVQSGMMS